MDFNYREKLNEIRAEASIKRGNAPERPHYAIPTMIVEKLLKEYKTKSEKLEEKISGLYDEPNKRYKAEGELEKIEAIIAALESPVLAKILF